MPPAQSDPKRPERGETFYWQKFVPVFRKDVDAHSEGLILLSTTCSLFGLAMRLKALAWFGFFCFLSAVNNIQTTKGADWPQYLTALPACLVSIVLPLFSPQWNEAGRGPVYDTIAKFLGFEGSPGPVEEDY